MYLVMPPPLHWPEHQPQLPSTAPSAFKEPSEQVWPKPPNELLKRNGTLLA